MRRVNGRVLGVWHCTGATGSVSSGRRVSGTLRADGLRLLSCCRVCRREDIDDEWLVEGVTDSRLGGGPHVPLNDE